MSDVTRRDFMKTASAMGAGVTIATGWSPFSYAQNEKVRVGCIGTGNQGTFHIWDGLTGAEAIEIVAICDVYEDHQKVGLFHAQFANAKVPLLPGESPNDLPEEQKAKARAALKPKGYYDYKEMLANEQLDAVIIATPLDTHYQITMDCLDAGLFCFTEKTLVSTIEEGRNLIKKCHETDKFVQVGHQRRYNPKYNLGMKLAFEDELLGRINHITAQWHRNHYWRRAYDKNKQLNEQEKKFITDLEQHLNWRLYMERSGGLFTELATHQTDIANWFLRTVPARVHAFGGLDYWRDGRNVDDNIVIAYEYDMKPGSDGYMYADPRSALQNPTALNRDYTVRFVYTSILANAKRGASELIQGDYGTLELTEDKCLMFVEPAPLAEAKAKMEAAKGGAAAGGASPAGSRVPGAEAIAKGEELLADKKLKTADVYQFEAFAHHIKNGGVPRTNQMTGFITAIGAIAAIQSRTEGRTVEIDPAWYQFDFEVPSWYEYEWDGEKYESIAPAESETAPEAAPEATDESQSA